MIGRHPGNILIIENDESVRTDVTNYLAGSGYRVIAAGDAQLGLELFQREKVDLALMDMHLPDMDGRAVMAEIKRLSPITPIIVFSGTDLVADVVDAMRHGAWDFITKPVTNSTLILEAVQRALERARLIEERVKHQERLEEDVAQRTQALRLANEELTREIAVRRRTEQELARSEKELESIVRAVPDIIYRLNPEGRFSFVSEAVKKYGYDPQDMIGKSIFDIIHMQDREKARWRINDRRTGRRKTNNFEIRLVTQRRGAAVANSGLDGLETDRVFLIEAEGIYDAVDSETGVFLGTQGIARDITLRKQAMEALRRSEESLAKAQEIAHLGSWEWDINADKIHWSDETYRLFGLEPQQHEINFDRYMQMVGPKDRKKVNQKIRDALDGIAPYDHEHRIIMKDGSDRIHHVRGEVYRDANGKPVRLVGTVHDITERKQAEKALRSSEERLKAVYKYVPVPMYIWIRTSNDFVLLDYNDAAEKTAETQIAGLLGVKAADLYRDDPEYLGDLERCFIGKTIVEREKEYRSLMTGGTKNLHITFSFVPPDLVLIQTVDITERKHAEEILRESEARFRQLVENINEVFWIHDLDMDEVLYLSPAYEKIWGLTERDSDIRKFSFLDSIHQEDRGRVEEAFARRRKTNQFDEEFRIVQPDGQVRWVRARIFPIYNEQGMVYREVGVAEDTTVAKRVEEERAWLATTVEQAEEIIIIYDSSGQFIQYVNPAFERHSGYKRVEVVGRSPNIIRSHLGDESLYREKAEAIVRGKVWSGRVINRKKDGAFYEVEETLSPVRDESGRVISYISIGRDVTREAMLERQLRQAQKMEAIGTLAGGIAHDFNNILGAIVGYSEMALHEETTAQEMRHYLEQVLKGGKRAKELVKQILTFSRQQEQEPRPVRVSLIIKEAVRFLRASLPSSIEIRREITNEPLMVLADPTQIHQVLMNLCSNAAHAMTRTGGVLAISLNKVDLDEEEVGKLDPKLAPGTYAMLAVEDTGQGIDPAIIDRIFDPFFTTKTSGEGTGMGLSVVHGIVKSCRGAITVNSKEGQGTSFHVYLPLMTSDFIEEVKTKAVLPLGQGQVLFVDDEEALVDIATRTLKILGYQVVATDSSKEALEIFSNSPELFEAVITDQFMPHMMGTELALKLKAIRPNIPIILCTGFSDSVPLEEARSIGIAETIVKPVVIQDFGEAIRRAIEWEANTGRSSPKNTGD